MAIHGNEVGPYVHVLHNWTYADATAREEATGFAATDVHKVALQSDDNSLWMLTDDDPITWERKDGGGGSVTASGTPTTGQIAEWTSATNVQGKAVNGTGNVLLSAGTAAIASGKTLTVSNSITLAGTDATTMTLPATSSTLMANPMTTAGDSIVGGTDGAPEVLALGSALQVRRVNAAGTAEEYVSQLPIASIASGTPDGTKFVRDDGTLVTPSGSGSPGGSTTQLQRNNAGNFGGILGATSDGTNVTFGSSNLRATNPLIDASAQMDLSGTARMFCGIAVSGDAIITAALTNDFCLRSQSTGNILLGVDSGYPVLKIVHSTTPTNYLQVTGSTSTSGPLISAAGSGSATLDVRIEGKGSGGLALNGTHPTFFWYRGGAIKAGATIEQGAGSFITGSAVDDLLFRTYSSGRVGVSTDNGTTLTFEVVANNGGIKTTAPTSGTAAAWKLGSKITSGTSALDTTGYVQLDIAGTLYKVALVTNS